MLRKLLVLCAAVGIAFAANAATEVAKPADQAAPADKAAVVEKAPVEKAAVTKAAVVEKVNINTADVKTLEKVKGIGKKKAEAIVKYRTENGEFKSVDDLAKIKCFKAKSIKKLEGKLTV